MEHAIKQNHRPTFIPPLTVIAAAENHSLPQLSSLALVPSPPPSENQIYRYLSFLDEHDLSSEREHYANAYVDLLFVLGRNIIQTGVHMEEWGWRRSILGYPMAWDFFDCSWSCRRYQEVWGE